MQRHRVRVAVLYQDRETFRRSGQIWRDVRIPVDAETPDEAEREAQRLAIERAEPPDGLTVIGACVIGISIP